MQLKHAHSEAAPLTAIGGLMAITLLLSALLVMSPALAQSPKGILGRTAPELELNSWIDGEGEAIKPIYLADLRGKVIYLYFFQDW